MEDLKKPSETSAKSPIVEEKANPKSKKRIWIIWGLIITVLLALFVPIPRHSQVFCLPCFDDEGKNECPPCIGEIYWESNFSHFLKRISNEIAYKKRLRLKSEFEKSAKITPLPTIDPTSSWKTYTNTKYRYSLKYPLDWVNDDDPASPANDLSSIGFFKSGGRTLEAKSSVRVFMVKNPKGLTLNEWIKDEDNRNNTVLGINIGEPTIVQVNSYKGYKFISKTSNNKDDIVYFIENNKTIYEIYLSITGQFQEETKSAFNQILSTFKFTDQPNNLNNKLKIIDGNVYRIFTSGKKQLLVDKEDYKLNPTRRSWEKDYKDRFFIFSYVSLSPDKTKMLLLAQGGITLNYLYYSNLNQISVKYIDSVINASWSHNSRYIAYTSKPADAGPVSKLQVYDTDLDKQVNITNSPRINNLNYDFLGFNEFQWLNDDSAIRVSYTAYDMTPQALLGTPIAEGKINIPLP